MTTELPRVPRRERHRRPPAARSAPPGRHTRRPAAAGSRARPRQRYADETMELPIFRELESAWFRTRSRARRDAEPAAAAGTGAPRPRRSTPPPAVQTPRAGRQVPHRWQTLRGRPAHRRTTGHGRRPPGHGDAARRRRAARGRPPPTRLAAARRRRGRRWRPPPQTGLPKRTPMAQLVPGGVEKPAVSVQRRTPRPCAVCCPPTTVVCSAGAPTRWTTHRPTRRRLRAGSNPRRLAARPERKGA